MIKISFKNTKSHKNETDAHFITKCLVWKLLLEDNHRAQMEWDSGSGVIDVFDWTSGIAYEIEPTSRPNKARLKLSQYTRDAMVKDVVIVPYNTIIKAVGTSDLKEWKKEIKKYVN